MEADEVDENVVPDEINDEVAPTALDFNLPLSKVKRIAKLVAPSSNITAEATQLLVLGAENYVRLLAKSAFKFSQLDNRKTIQLKDVYRCIERDWHFSILEDAIDDWPESQGGSLHHSTIGKSSNPRTKASNINESINVDEANENEQNESHQDIEPTGDRIDGENDESPEDEGVNLANDDYFDVEDEDLRIDQYYEDENQEQMEAESGKSPSNIETKTAIVCDIEDL